ETKKLPNYPVTADGNKTSQDANQNITLTGWQQPTTAAVKGQTRLRTAALPGISVARLTTGDVAGNSLLKIITGAFRNNANLDISLDAIETAELDHVTAYRVFSGTLTNRLQRDATFRNAICAITSLEGDDGVQQAKIEMVTRVFYARVINYSYGNNAAATLRGATGLAAVSANAVTANDVVKDIPKPGTDGDTVTAPDPSATQKGEVVNIGISSKESLLQREVFERPMAFGIESITFSPYDLGLRCVTNPQTQQYQGQFAADSFLQKNPPAQNTAMTTWDAKHRTDGAGGSPIVKGPRTSFNTGDTTNISDCPANFANLPANLQEQHKGCAQ
ncbi:MAG: hypothetical protein AAF701_08765, partial [Pseudomonadota bacterium]